MGTLVVTENMSLDGVIEQVDDWFSPAAASHPDTSDVEATLRDHMKRQDALLLGRKTFEAFRGYWPTQMNDRTGIRDHLNEVPKYVFSSTLSDPEWDNTTVVRGDVVEEVEKLKARTAREIGVTGSITLVRDLVAAELIDEYRLLVYPVGVGRGRRLFEEAHGLRKLVLMDVKPHRSGVILMTYRPATR